MFSSRRSGRKESRRRTFFPLPISRIVRSSPQMSKLNKTRKTFLRKVHEEDWQFKGTRRPGLMFKWNDLPSSLGICWRKCHVEQQKKSPSSSIDACGWELSCATNNFRKILYSILHFLVYETQSYEPISTLKTLWSCTSFVLAISSALDYLGPFWPIRITYPFQWSYQ